MKRERFVSLLGAALFACPVAAHAQSSTVPVVGFLHPASAERFAPHVAAFREGLSEHGYFEGRNLKIEYRWAEGHGDRLKEMAADLARRQVAVLAAPGGGFAAVVAKAATTTIPILFIAGPNPVEVGLVSSISRPGGNATGVAMESTEMLAKRLELLRELVPHTTKVAMLMSPAFTVEKYEREFVRSKELIGLKLANGADYEQQFAAAAKDGARGLIVSADANFTAHHERIVGLAAKYGMPAVYPWRQYAAAGGLASYGPSLVEAYRQIGRYAGRILKGAHPETMPVEAPNTFELVLNLKTAQSLGLEVPDSLKAIANEKLE